MNIPTTKQLCEAERFVIGLKMLANECNMSGVEYSKLGIIKFEFGDGSTVGGLRAYMDAGLIKSH